MLKIIKCKPMLNHIITTANVYEESQINGGVIDDEGKLEGKFKEYQTVVAVGPHVRDVQVGDLVIINPSAYCKPRHKTKADSIKGLMGEDEVEMIVEFPIIDINGEPHLFLFDRDIDLIIEEKEFINDSLDENKDIIE
jgi:hypothetical protein